MALFFSSSMALSLIFPMTRYLFFEETTSESVDQLASTSNRWQNLCIVLNLPEILHPIPECKYLMFRCCLSHILNPWRCGHPE
ncbi:hypothetical protein VTN02DRAFT_3345 [Thermoascus thermophilus]